MKMLVAIGGNRSAAVAAMIALMTFGVMGCGGNTPAEPAAAGGELELDENGKTPICHFQQDIGTWTLVKLSLEAALEHLDKHDDAVPGGITKISKTRLDSQCRRVN